MQVFVTGGGRGLTSPMWFARSSAKGMTFAANGSTFATARRCSGLCEAAKQS
jgi:hypothetical protein